MLGVAFIISVESGEVLDYEFTSTFCFECKAKGHWDKNGDCHKSWYLSHESICIINSTLLSKLMEKVATVETFCQSFSIHNLKYTAYVWDGDSKYGNNYLLLKEDCVGHAERRMGSNLKKYKRDMKGKLSDGATEGGQGRLTDNFQIYYGAAIRNNKNSLHKIKDAIWTIYYYCILVENEPLSQQHYLLPKR